MAARHVGCMLENPTLIIQIESKHFFLWFSFIFQIVGCMLENPALIIQIESKHFLRFLKTFQFDFEPPRNCLQFGASSA